MTNYACIFGELIPDAVLVSGQITGEAAEMGDLEAVKAVLPDTPVLTNTGVKLDTVADVLRIADGCVVGNPLKVDGNSLEPGRPRPRRRFHGPRPRRARPPLMPARRPEPSTPRIRLRGFK